MEHHVLRKNFVPSTWAVWLLLGHSQTSWLLMWAYKKTPQVIRIFRMSLAEVVSIFFLTNYLNAQVKPAGGPFIQPQSKGQKVKKSEWVMTSSLLACPLKDTWWVISRPLLYVHTVLNLTSCPMLTAPVLRQWRSDGGCLLHADTVEHESN